MNRAAFRRFEFFEFDSISQNLPSALGGIATCAVAESGLLIFGDELGNIIFADREMKVSEKKYKIFNGEVISLAYIFDSQNNNKQYIICIGDDSRPSFDPTEGFSSAGASAQPINVIKLFSVQDMIHPLQVINATVSDAVVTAFAVQDEGLEIAVGYSNGKVLLFTGMISPRDGPNRPSPATVLIPEHFAPVSSLHFYVPRVQKSPEIRRIKLFVVMETKDNSLATSTEDQPLVELDEHDIEHAGIMVFDTSLMLSPVGNNKTTGGFVLSPRQNPRALDEKGATRFNTSYFKGSGELVVARNEAIYTYTTEDKGGAVAIFGDKIGVHTVGRYTLVLSIDDKPQPVNVGISGEKPKKTAMNMYDMKNRFICGTAKKQFIPANDRLAFLFSDTGVVYIVTVNGLLLRYLEKDVGSKLKVLLEQASPPLYSLAITLAMEEQLEASEVMKLYQQYGDYLYEKQEYESAISQYCQTIGYLPPSYVIIKFLDPYRIENLITYLEKIREKNLAASNHISLLLNCYAKVKDEEKIRLLLESLYEKIVKIATGSGGGGGGGVSSGSSSNNSQNLDLINHFRTLATNSSSTHHNSNSNSDSNNRNEVQHQRQLQMQAIFDPNSAVSILQSAGYVELALQTAIRYRLHDAYLTLQLVDKTPPLVDESLGYLAYMALLGVSNEELVSSLHSFGSTLLTHRARAFTNLMIKLCNGTLDALMSSVIRQAGAATNTASATNNAVNNKEESQQIAAFMRTLQTLLTANNISAASTNTSSFPVEEVLPILADDSEHLLMFLEGVTMTSTSSTAASPVSANNGRLLPAKVWMTLLELYLTLWSQKVDVKAERDEFSTKIMAILDGAQVSYDAAHVLLLCHIYGYDQGRRYLLERQNYVELVMLQLMNSSTTSIGKNSQQQQQKQQRELFKLLRRDGSKDPELFLQVLTFLVQQTISPDDASAIQAASNKKRGSKLGEVEDEEEVLRDLRPAADDEDDSKWDVIVDLVELISKEAILSPIQVMSTLAINPRLPLHIIADYVQSTFRELSDHVGSIEADVKEAKRRLDQVPSSSAVEMEMKRAAKKEARAAARKATSRYDGYDDDEEDDDEEEVMQQAKLEQEKWMQIRRSQVECSQDHEAFFKELEMSADGFSTVAGYFGRSLINY